MSEGVNIGGFGRLLASKGLASEDALAKVVSEATRRKVMPEQLILSEKLVDVASYVLAASEYLGMAPVTIPEGIVPDAELLGANGLDFWERVKAVPVERTDGRCTVVFGNPFDLPAQDEVAEALGGRIWACAATEQDVTAALMRVRRRMEAADPTRTLEAIMSGGDAPIEVVDADEAIDAAGTGGADEEPVIRMVNAMMTEALESKASDIHFEPLEKVTRLRYRIDGLLVPKAAPPKSLHASVVSRIKIMSNLDIAERRRPQDGRFKMRVGGKVVDVRVSVLPTVHGEKVVMRILDKTNLMPGLAYLGLDDYSYRAMRHVIEQPHGIILVTGPTGSGKTTTLYSCLQDLNKEDVNIVTAEDPVEYEIEGINQCHVNVAQGLTFSGILRSVLRQDPDIVLVGEIRDNETADIAVKAALTGHLVLSTLHTNDACGVVARLIDMEVPPFLLASSLVLAQAQRLYRKLCPFCKREVPLDLRMLEQNGVAVESFRGVKVYGPAGCEKCHGIGYKGRGAFMEVLPVSDAIRGIIQRGGDAALLRATAISEGMVPLKEAGMCRVRSGETSLEAALAVTGGE